MVLLVTDPLSQLSLPPGFRFYPTDEELMVQYLCRKVAGHQFTLQIIGDIDLYKFDPWVLPSKAIFGEKEWYFFSPRDRKYPNGSRPNRVAGSGYWKATGTDKTITTQGRKVGIKKALVFYVGKAPKGTKTNWIMHEYRLSEPQKKNGSLRLDDWVLCRIYKKNSSGQKPISDVQSIEHSHGSCSSPSSQVDEMLEFESLPEIDDRFFTLPTMNSRKAIQPDEKLNLQRLGSGNFDWASLAAFNSLPEYVSGVQALARPTQGHVNDNNNNNNQNGVYVPSIPQICQVDSKFEILDEEIPSGCRTISAYFQQNPNSFPQNYHNSVDPFGIGYPTKPGSFGFGQ
ncbi:unnamed protein product [Ilex paraguariensis]|uniref:NAC domain-containing protein n=1 Tax=Ilex paraguariensis TaxID=185542 RepID=A0ABC8UPR0_9AQUA